jgi:hypothetical protein
MQAPRPIFLNDEELTAVFAAAQPIEPGRRSAFLEALASRLRGQEVGPGAVGRAIRELQRDFWTPPLSTAEIGESDQPRMRRGKYA